MQLLEKGLRWATSSSGRKLKEPSKEGILEQALRMEGTVELWASPRPSLLRLHSPGQKQIGWGHHHL